MLHRGKVRLCDSGTAETGTWPKWYPVQNATQAQEGVLGAILGLATIFGISLYFSFLGIAILSTARIEDGQIVLDDLVDQTLRICDLLQCEFIFCKVSAFFGCFVLAF